MLCRSKKLEVRFNGGSHPDSGSILGSWLKPPLTHSLRGFLVQAEP
jgi:hypothetical protein